MRRFHILVPVFLFITLAGCGYHLVGKGGAFPQGVEKVAVEAFKNSTDRYGLEGEAQEAFVEELLATGKVKVSDMKDADAWFTGTLTSYGTEPIAYTAGGDILERRLYITARIEFYIRDEEKAFFSEDNLRGKAEYPVSDDLVSSSQAENDAMREALADLAMQVVSRLIQGF